MVLKMLFKKLLRTVGLYRSQFISMIIMIALGVGVFVGFNMEWVSIEKNTSDFFDKTGFADYRIVSENGFSAEQLEKIKDIKGVDAAARYVCTNVGIVGRPDDSVALAVTEDEKVSGMYLVSGDKYDKNSADGIWLSDKYAAANDISVGDELTFSYKGINISGKVKGLIKSGEQMICIRDETQLMPDYTLHGFAYISPVLYKNSLGIDYYPQINILSSLDKSELIERADKALGKTELILTKNETASYSGASGETEEGKTMGSVLPVLFLLIAVLTMVTTMHRIAAKEKTQIGTLKALGFKDRRILRHYTSYATFIGAVGSLFGVAIGYLIAWAIMNPNGMMGTYMDLPEWHLYFPWFCYVVIAALLIFLTLIGYLSFRQMLKGTAADALRPYTPKKMKPLLIEKTGFFHRLSFGTRWNMRDIMRHKSRTAMSLIGIIGGMILTVGSLGMGDTMDAFLDLYYNGATNYASRIYLAEDATAEERQEVADKYNGDTSASVSVQIEKDGKEKKAVSLDIYSITHDMVRFPAKKDGYVKLEDNGAYVCIRIADEYDLKPGDTITLSPYGTDEKYELKVSGIIRSVSESIVMTSGYADKCGVKYTTDSVYTDTAATAVGSSAAIKHVQAKQAIIDSFDSFTELMDLMIIILIIGALLLSIVVLYNLGVMSYTERYREMATLKVVGFKDKKIGQLLISQNLWLSIIGIIVGLPAGIGVLDYLLKALAGEYEMRLAISPRTVIISIALTFGVSLLVSFMVSRKNKNIDMVEALKGAE